MVNTSIAVYAKSPLAPAGDPMDLVDFVRQPCVPGAFDIVDPCIVWDNETNRWYYLALLAKRGTFIQNCLVYGWSKRPNPVDLANGWCHRHTEVTRTQDDYPKLGDNQGWMIVGTNVRASSSPLSGYLHSLIYAFKKPPRGPVACAEDWPRWYPSDPLRPIDRRVPFSPIPSNANFGHPHTAGWVVGAQYEGGAAVFWRVREENGVPRISPMGFVTIPDWSIPASADQPGPHNLQTMDGRFTNAVARRDPTLSGNPPPITIWTQQTVDAQRGRTRIRWYQFIPGATPPGIRQGGGGHEIVKPNHFVFNGAISPAWNGTDVMIHYNTSSPSENVKILARARTAQTPLGKFGTEIFPPLYTSPNPYDDVGDGACEDERCDWGHYAAAVPEPLQARWIWGATQAVRVPDGVHQPWLTRVFAGRVSD
jgi:hypothetical protein